ncbi:MAG: hypothetical protein QXF82_00845 [Nitrososphaeria archaeon]
MLKPGEFKFEDIVYKGPYNTKRTRCIEKAKCIGFDSESDRNGKTLVFCLSNGTVIEPEEMPEKILRKYRGFHFFTWNLRYEQGAIIQLLPHENRVELWKTEKTVYNGIKYTVTGRKHMTIAKLGSKSCIHFWDIAPFYGMSLCRAAKIYLQKEKLPIEYENLDEEYFKQNYRKICEACINHAKLTYELGIKLIDILNKMGIQVNNLYSQASIAAEWFAKCCGVEDVLYLWNDEKNREVLRFACESYRGGKFEISERGYFPHLKSYDIVSAYPYEISRLVSLKNTKILWSNHIPEESIIAYGFLRCKIKIKDQLPHSVGILKNGIRCYPIGIFYATITYNEYKYLLENNADIDIIKAVWILTYHKKYPYKKEIERLVQLKNKYKNKLMEYRLCKIIMNGFYGKLAQLIKQGNIIKAGPYWNPIFASYITANVRIRISQLQQEFGYSIKAVHTDSVLIDKSLELLKPEIVGKDLGKFSKENEGEAIIISTGNYQIGKKIATRGLCFEKGESWKDKLQQFPKQYKIKITNRNVLSWREAIRIHKEEFINKFIEEDKIFDLNYDKKRLWLEEFNTEDFLNKTEKGFLFPIFELKPFWERSDLKP